MENISKIREKVINIICEFGDGETEFHTRDIEAIIMDSDEKFTLEEIKTYLLSKDSMGDILYYLNSKSIKKANEVEDDE